MDRKRIQGGVEVIIIIIMIEIYGECEGRRSCVTATHRRNDRIDSIGSVCLDAFLARLGVPKKTFPGQDRHFCLMTSGISWHLGN